MKKKFAFILEYNGQAYHGWQRQSECHSLQETVETAIAKLANHPVHTYCAGRTDAGVHATAQVIHFESDANRTLQQWHFGVNSYLPQTIRIREVIPVHSEFHARFSAQNRRYMYAIHCATTPSAFLHNYVYWLRQPLDIEAMNQAAAQLIGEFNFHAFRSSQCQSLTAVRKIVRLHIVAVGELVIVDICANAFLHHMVRIIVAHLLQVGLKNRTVEWLGTVRDAKVRDPKIAMVPARGLHLIDVHYPESCNVQNISKNPWFLAS